MGGKGGVLGIKYEQVSKVTNQSDVDWKKFIRPTGKLTRTVQLLLQKATEAYVYSVLGAQARTHWTIMGRCHGSKFADPRNFCQNSERQRSSK